MLKMLSKVFLIFISKILLIEIFFLKKNFTYCKTGGFGDFIFFCLNLKKNPKKKIYCYSKLQYNIANFFFDKKNIKKSFFTFLPLLEKTNLASDYLSKSIIFKPEKINNFDNSIKPTKQNIKYIKNQIKKEDVSEKLKIFCQKKFFVLFIKHYHTNTRKITPSIRQSSNMKKNFQIINFLAKKKINLLILGNSNDKFTNYSKLKYKNTKNIYFFEELSQEFSLNDQAFVALNSDGYIGSASGASILYYLLKKKIIHFDTYFQNTDIHAKNIIWLYKKIKTPNGNKELTYNFLKKNNNQYLNLIENNFKEIKKKINLLF